MVHLEQSGKRCPQVTVERMEKRIQLICGSAPKFWKLNIYSQSLVFWAKVCKRYTRVLTD